jgi:hypothetical protein
VAMEACDFVHVFAFSARLGKHILMANSLKCQVASLRLVGPQPSLAVCEVSRLHLLL